jgi:putative endonuclease
MHYVYVLKSKKDGNFYVGCTNDLRKRFESHNKGEVPSTKFRKPFDLIYYEASSNKEDALKREKYLKTTYGHRYIRNRVKHYLELSS